MRVDDKMNKTQAVLAKSARFHVRATSRQAQLIRAGASRRGVKLTDDILDSLCAQAEMDLADQNHFVLPKELIAQSALSRSRSCKDSPKPQARCIFKPSFKAIRGYEQQHHAVYYKNSKGPLSSYRTQRKSANCRYSHRSDWLLTVAKKNHINRREETLHEKLPFERFPASRHEAGRAMQLIAPIRASP